MVVTFDVETSTKNKGNPFSKSGQLVSYSCKPDNLDVSFNYYTEPDFMEEIRALFTSAKLLIGFNIKFDLHWMARAKAFPKYNVRVWDCQIAEFIISGQKVAYPSLDYCLEKYGLGQKDDKIAEYWNLGIDTCDIPREELEHYNNLDVELTYKLYLRQQEIMTEAQKRLCLLQGLDLLVLQEMEFNGVKFDRDLCSSKAAETKASLKEVTDQLLKFSPTTEINLDSGPQLSCLLYGGTLEVDYITEVEAIYKSGPKKGTPYIKNVHNIVEYPCPRLFEPLPKTETKLKKKLLSGKEITIYETNEDVIKQLKASEKWKKQVISLLLKRAELAKLLDTYYGKLPAMLETMEWGDYIHGQYNQCVAATGRLSSSQPNMQNFSGDVDALLVSRYVDKL